MITNYFTFGKGQVHSEQGRTFDSNTIIAITSENPRQKMIDLFGLDWGFQYDSYEDLDPKKWWTEYTIFNEKLQIIEVYKNGKTEKFTTNE